ncbi:MAG: hypothetical protein RLZZ283_309 [Candidatus Parcubacteria bacterium]|jgi:hypothetical protein
MTRERPKNEGSRLKGLSESLRADYSSVMDMLFAGLVLGGITVAILTSVLAFPALAVPIAIAGGLSYLASAVLLIRYFQKRGSL